MNSQSSDGPAGGEVKKQPYISPKLVEYGALRNITLTVGSTGAKDNHPANTRTRP